jgi:hypothetical protein
MAILTILGGLKIKIVKIPFLRKICGNLWQFVAIFGNFWQFLAIFGNFWQFLAICGNLAKNIYEIVGPQDTAFYECRASNGRDQIKTVGVVNVRLGKVALAGPNRGVASGRDDDDSAGLVNI